MKKLFVASMLLCATTSSVFAAPGTIHTTIHEYTGEFNETTLHPTTELQMERGYNNVFNLFKHILTDVSKWATFRPSFEFINALPAGITFDSPGNLVVNHDIPEGKYDIPVMTCTSHYDNYYNSINFNLPYEYIYEAPGFAGEIDE